MQDTPRVGRDSSMYPLLSFPRNLSSWKRESSWGRAENRNPPGPSSGRLQPPWPTVSLPPVMARRPSPEGRRGHLWGWQSVSAGYLTVRDCYGCLRREPRKDKELGGTPRTPRQEVPCWTSFVVPIEAGIQSRMPRTPAPILHGFMSVVSRLTFSPLAPILGGEERY